MKSLATEFKRRGMALGMKLMNDPKNQQRVLKAMDALQRGRTQLADLAEQVLHRYGLPTQKDIKGISKKMTALKKQAAEIAQRLNEIG